MTNHRQDEEFQHSWSEKAWPVLAFLAPICVTGFITNAIVVWVFVKWRILLNFQKINLSVVNLAISNVAICIVAPPLIALPIFLAHTAETPEQELASDMVYRVSACLFGLASYANSFATTAIALHRRRMILKPRAQMKNEKPQLPVCFLMWGISLALALPELFRCATSSEDHDETSSADETLPTLQEPYQRLAVEVARVTLQFIIPSMVMIFSYVSVFVALRKRSIIRAQFHDKTFKGQTRADDRLASVLYRNNANIGQVVNGDAKAVTATAADGQQAVGRTKSYAMSQKKAPVVSVGATVTTTVGNSSSGRPQSTSCETDNNGPTIGGPGLSNNSGLSANLSSSNLRKSTKRIKKMTSIKVKTVWNSIREKKFSASDSKNVCILIATIVVHFACWSPYNLVRLYIAIVEAVNNAEEPRAPIAEGVVLCIAVSSVLHCPIFYTWFNRRNRHGLVACCAAIIPCRESNIRRRLRDLARQGNTNRYRLPLPIDTPPARSPRRASRLQSRFQITRRRSRGGVLEELRMILYNAGQRRSTTSQAPPPARHNSFLSDCGGTETPQSESGKYEPMLMPTAESTCSLEEPISFALMNQDGVDDEKESFWTKIDISDDLEETIGRGSASESQPVEPENDDYDLDLLASDEDRLQLEILDLAAKVSKGVILAATASTTEEEGLLIPTILHPPRTKTSLADGTPLRRAASSSQIIRRSSSKKRSPHLRRNATVKKQQQQQTPNGPFLTVPTNHGSRK